MRHGVSLANAGGVLGGLTGPTLATNRKTEVVSKMIEWWAGARQGSAIVSATKNVI